MASLAAASDDRRLGEGGDAEAGGDLQHAGRGQFGLRHSGLGSDVFIPGENPKKIKSKMFLKFLDFAGFVLISCTCHA